MQNRKSSYFCLLFVIFACLFSVSIQKRSTSLYDASKSHTLLLTRDNFDKQITKHRSKLVSVIHFYKYDDDGSSDLSFEFEKFAAEWQGAFRIATVDCYEQYELCEKEKVTKTPVVRVYPVLPVPSFDYEGDSSSKGWTASASRFVQSNVLEINSTNFNKFTSENPSVPKAFLFTDKPGVPLIFKALSVAFEKKIFLGLVRNDQKEIFNQYGVRTTPKIMIIKPTDKKVVFYDGELKYGKIFDFLNIYTETFVPGGENLDFEKPWNREIFPELHQKSASDICFSHEGFLCGIYLAKSQPDASVAAVVEQLTKSNVDNKYKYMWLNVETQTRFAQAFVVDELPKIVFLSHGKRKKYVIHEGDFTKSAIEYTLEKIGNGDARFKHIGEDLPPLN